MPAKPTAHTSAAPNKTALVAVSGMSPAILTETLWALANEAPAVVPDEVIVITTSKGESDMQRDLLSPVMEWGQKSVWENLRYDIFKKVKLPRNHSRLQLSIRVIELPDPNTGIRQPASDLRTRDHNDEAADFIIRTLAPLCDAQDQRVIASIAGGRKTMGALLYAGMSLLGKETDRVTHVLVSEPFDSVRGFFYPEQPVQALETRIFGKPPTPVTARDAKVEMADIPFVPLRNKFDELKEPGRTFAGLVAAYSRTDQGTLKQAPTIHLDEVKGLLTVNGKGIKLAGRDLLITAFLADRAVRREPHFQTKDDAKDALAKFMALWKQRHPFHKATTRLTKGGVTADDIAKVLHPLREKLTKVGLQGAIAYLAPERNRIGFDISLE